MPRSLRDAAGAAAVLLVLFATLMVFVPSMRQKVLPLASGTHTQLLDPGRMASGVMQSTAAMALSYASDNTYMVGFLIVAGFLFFLMLRT
jgi:hypothetical protein